MVYQVETGIAFRAQRTLVRRVAFHVLDAGGDAILHRDEKAASDATIRTDGWHIFGIDHTLVLLGRL